MDDLRQALKNCLNELLAKIIENPYTIFQRQLQKVVIEEDDNLRTVDIAEPDYIHSFNIQARSIIDQYDFTNFNQFIEENYPYLNGQIGSRYGSMGYRGERWIQKLIYNILHAPPSVTDLQSAIDSEIKMFLCMLSDPVYTMITYFPVRNLRLPDRETKVSFSKSIQVRELDEDELTHLFRNLYGLPDFTELCRSAIIISYEDDIIFDMNRKLAREDPILKFDQEIDHIIHSLNLVSDGALGCTSRIRQIEGYAANFIGGSSHKSFTAIHGPSVTLSKDQAQQWKSLYAKLRSLKTNSFDLALNKLHEAEIRLSAQDSIIDAVIGLESLLLNQVGNEKTRGELTYRFCTNYASLFPPDDRLEKYNEAKEVYHMRSSLVHGGSMKSDIVSYSRRKIRLVDLKQIIINHLRVVLGLLLDNYDSEPFDSELYWLKKVLA